MAARIRVDSTDRFIGGDVAGGCDAGSPGSDGASPYRSFALPAPGAPYINLNYLSRSRSFVGAKIAQRCEQNTGWKPGDTYETMNYL